MKPFAQCPVCQKDLVKIYNPLWMEKCEDCPIKFSQYHPLSFDDEDLRYIVFYTENFFIYVYFKETLSLKANTMYIYHKIFPRGESTQGPCLILKLLPIDFNNLNILDEKFKTLTLFS